jgi:hypothetical protein
MASQRKPVCSATRQAQAAALRWISRIPCFPDPGMMKLGTKKLGTMAFRKKYVTV